MGDRANVMMRGYKFKGGERMAGVFFYTHGDGYSLPATVADALNSPAGRSRADDGSYLARIIFCRMVGDDIGGATGYGISTGVGDNDGYPILVVDAATRRIYLAPVPHGSLHTHGEQVDVWVDNHPEAGLSYDEFIAIATEGWKGLEAATNNRLAAAASAP